MKRCVIFGAAPFGDVEPLKRYLQAEDMYIAADGGGKLALALGITPMMTVADHDSSVSTDDMGECVILPVQKDVTDTRAAMFIAFERGYREFVLLGCLGGRLDHTTANLLAARQLTEQGANVLLADEKTEVTVLLPGTHTKTAEGFSLFAMSERVEGLSVEGAEYPLHDFTLTSDNALCVSNRAVAPCVQVSFDNGVLLWIAAKD